MDARLTRIILFVQDERLAAFCRDALGLAVVEAIAGEWAVLKAGACGVPMGASSPIRPSPARCATAPTGKATCSNRRSRAPSRNATLVSGVSGYQPAAMNFVRASGAAFQRPTTAHSRAAVNHACRYNLKGAF